MSSGQTATGTIESSEEKPKKASRLKKHSRRNWSLFKTISGVNNLKRDINTTYRLVASPVKDSSRVFGLLLNRATQDYYFKYEPEKKVTKKEIQKASLNILLSGLFPGALGLMCTGILIFNIKNGLADGLSILASVLGILILLCISASMIYVASKVAKQKPGINPDQAKYESEGNAS